MLKHFMTFAVSCKSATLIFSSFFSAINDRKVGRSRKKSQICPNTKVLCPRKGSLVDCKWKNSAHFLRLQPYQYWAIIHILHNLTKKLACTFLVYQTR
jgi:hypothetical protein